MATASPWGIDLGPTFRLSWLTGHKPPQSLQQVWAKSMHPRKFRLACKRTIANALENQRFCPARANSRQRLQLGNPGVIDIDSKGPNHDPCWRRQYATRKGTNG